jgi:predicted GNAT family N-acyltransferase
MGQLVFVKGYKDNEEFRDSFNQLATGIFGIEFETWYQHGYWTKKYQPYSFVDNGKVVANVSVNLLTLIINNEEKQAVQIGTVMTHTDYRSQGLSKKLMDRVLEDFKSVDLFYLFANQSVLEFYPKFGFETVREVQFSMDYSYSSSDKSGIRKLDGRNPEDLTFIYNLSVNRISVSQVFDAKGSEELLMFYCIMVFTDDIYYLEDEESIVIYQIENHELHLFHCLSTKQVKVKDILSKIANENITKVIFHYHPDHTELKIEKQPYPSSNVLFVKNMTNVSLPEEFKHPITSQA